MMLDKINQLTSSKIPLALEDRIKQASIELNAIEIICSGDLLLKFKDFTILKNKKTKCFEFAWGDPKEFELFCALIRLRPRGPFNTGVNYD